MTDANFEQAKSRNQDEVVDWVHDKKTTLEAGRKNYESLCQKVAEYFCPNRDDWNERQSKGEDRVRRIYNPLGVQCIEMAAADLYGLLTDPSGNWFEYRFENPDAISDDMKVWLRRQSEIVFEKLYSPAARASQAFARSYHDDLAYGTDVIFVSWNSERNCPLLQNLRLSECFVDEDETGIVDTLIRKYELSVKSIKHLYPKANLSDNLKRDILDNKTDKKYRIIHAVFPTHENSKHLTTLPYTSIIYVDEDKTVLEVSGFEEFPFSVCRWETAPGEVYGRSKAMTAYADVMSLQLMTKEMLESAQLANRPMIAIKHAEERPQIPVFKPGGVIEYEDEMPQPFNAGNNYHAAMEVIANIEDRVKHEFSLYKINDLQGTHRTREEILQRISEGTRLLGPVAGRQMTEKLDIILLRVFNLCARNGVLEPPPEDVDFLDLKVVYNSPIAKMMKYERATRYEQALASMASFIQFDQQSVDNLNVDVIMREISAIFGVPELMKSYDEVISQRQAQAQAMAQQQQVAEVQNGLALAGQFKNVVGGQE